MQSNRSQVLTAALPFCILMAAGRGMWDGQLQIPRHPGKGRFGAYMGYTMSSGFHMHLDKLGTKGDGGSQIRMFGENVQNS